MVEMNMDQTAMFKVLIENFPGELERMKAEGSSYPMTEFDRLVNFLNQESTSTTQGIENLCSQHPGLREKLIPVWTKHPNFDPLVGVENEP